MRRIDTATKAVDLFGAGKHGFKDGDPALAILATKLNAEFFNSVQEELASVVEAVGLGLNPADNTQLLQAIRLLPGRVLDKSIAGGANVTLTAAESQYPMILLTGVITANINVIVPNAGREWVVANNTTGPFTVTVKTAAGSGVAVTQGTSAHLYCDIANVGQPTVTIAEASTSVKGRVQLATAAEAQALSDALKSLTPATLAAAFAAGNQSLSANGYQKLPGGLILQWGNPTASATADVPVTFPITFPNALLFLGGQAGQNTSNVFAVFTSESETTSGFVFNAVSAGGRNAFPCKYFALGN